MSFIPQVCEQKRDEILDKIKAGGVHAMSASEKYFLDNFEQICQDYSKDNQNGLTENQLNSDDDQVLTFNADVENVKISLKAIYEYDQVSFETGNVITNFVCHLRIVTPIQDLTFSGKIVCINNKILGLDFHVFEIDNELLDFDDDMYYLPIGHFYSVEMLGNIKEIVQGLLNSNVF